MFALTLLGGVDVLNSLLALGTRVSLSVSLAAVYAVVPGIAAVFLARRLWTGGKAVWFALIGLQAWLLIGGVVNLYAGSERGFSQLLLPGALLALVTVGASRAWFELPGEQRAVRPSWTLERLRRDGTLSLPHLITWRRNRGQSTVEYVGMVGLVALIIGALLFSGVGPQVSGGLQDVVCRVLGGDCESNTVAGDGDNGGGDNGGGDNGGGSNSGGGDSGGGNSGGDDSGGGNNGGGSNSGGGDSGGDSDGDDSGGGNNGGGSDGGGDSGGGDSGGGSDGGSDNGGSSSGGGDSGGGNSGGGDSGGGSDGGSDNGGSDGGSDNGGSSSGGGDSGGGDSGGGDSGGGNSGGGDSGGSDGGSDNGGSDNGGSDGGSDNGGSSSGGGDSGGGDSGGGNSGGGDSGGGSDGGSDNGGSSSGGSDNGGSSSGGGDSGGGSDSGGSDSSGGSSGGSSDGGSDSGGSDSGGSDSGGSDSGGSDGGSDSGGGSNGGGSNGGSGSIGGLASGGLIGGLISGGLIGGLIGGGSSSGGSSSGGSSGGGSSGGGSSSGGSEDDEGDEDEDEDEDEEEEETETETVCNPVMAPWGIMQSCTEVEKPKDPDKDKDKDKDDDDQDDDQDEDDEDGEDEDDCRDNTNVAFYGSVSNGAAGSGRYTLAAAGTRTHVYASGDLLVAAPVAPSPMDLARTVSGSSLAGVDTFQEVEDRLSNALGLTDEPNPPPDPSPEAEDEPEDDPEDEPSDESPGGDNCSTVTNNPMDVLKGIPDFRPGDKKEWAREVEEIAGRNPLTKDFTAEDALIVADYTGSWADDANSYLRGNTIPGRRGTQVPKFIERMDLALEHLPPVDGTFYRGTFMPDALLDRFASGEVVELPEYLSTSSDPAKADRAVEASANKGRTGGESVLMEVTTDNGRNIDDLSRYRGKESEVLVPRGGKFEKTGETTKIIGGKEYKVIQVKQVG